jgi:hypothetical protein
MSYSISPDLSNLKPLPYLKEGLWVLFTLVNTACALCQIGTHVLVISAVDLSNKQPSPHMNARRVSNQLRPCIICSLCLMSRRDLGPISSMNFSNHATASALCQRGNQVISA